MAGNFLDSPASGDLLTCVATLMDHPGPDGLHYVFQFQSLSSQGVIHVLRSDFDTADAAAGQQWVFYQWLVSAPDSANTAVCLHRVARSRTFELEPCRTPHSPAILEVEAQSGSMALGAALAGFGVTAVFTADEQVVGILHANHMPNVCFGSILDMNFLASVHTCAARAGQGILVSICGCQPKHALAVLQATFQLGVLWQVAFVLVECDVGIASSFEVGVLIQAFNKFMGFQSTSCQCQLARVWPLYRNSQLLLLHSARNPCVSLDSFPNVPRFAALSQVVSDWSFCNREELTALLWTPEDIEALQAIGKSPSSCLLNMQGVCPGFFGISSEGVPSVAVRVLEPELAFRHLAAREASFICTFPLDYSLTSGRKVLSLLSRSTPPVIVLWTLLRYVEAFFQPGAPLPKGSADSALESHLAQILQCSRDKWPIPSIAAPFSIVLKVQHATIPVQVEPFTRVEHLLAAESRLGGWGLRVQISSHGRLLALDSYLRPGTYELHHQEKTSARDPPIEPLTVVVETGESQQELRLPFGSFVWELRDSLSLPSTVQVTGMLPGPSVRMDSRIFHVSHVRFTAGGASAGMDHVMLSELAHQTSELQHALRDSSFRFLEPHFLSTILLQHPEVGLRKLARLLPPKVTKVAGFFAYGGHWALVTYDAHLSPPGVYYDGAPGRLHKQAQWILEAIHEINGGSDFALQQRSLLKQHGGSHCGSIALANLQWHLNPSFTITEPQLLAFHETYCPSRFVGGGAMDFAAAQKWLTDFLPGKGVPPEKAQERAAVALKKLGVSVIARCIDHKNPWQALKQAGNEAGRQFQWVSYEELQTHIASQSLNNKGADGSDRPRKPRKAERKPPSNTSFALTPSRLHVPEAAFVDQVRSPLPQIQLDNLSPTARGVVVVTLAQALPFLKDDKSVSVDALALLTTQEVPSEAHGLLPVVNMRWPAIYAGTQEPILVCGSLIQLGDENVAKANAAGAFPKPIDTILLRVQVYRDQYPDDWSAFIKGPVRSLCYRYPCMQKCNSVGCGASCPKYHSPVDEEVDSVLLDVFGWRWYKADGKTDNPAAAASFSVLLRVPASAAKAVMDLSGSDGVYVERRADAGTGPHPDHSVIWLPSDSFEAVLHRKRTIEKVLQVARLHHKYGVRVKSADEADVRAAIFPGQTFVACKVTEIYHVGPFPHGSTKKAIQDFLTGRPWIARPLRPVASAKDGRFWEVGAEQPPPSLIFSMGSVDLTVTHVRSRQHPGAEQPAVLASMRTMKHLQLQGSDPWDAADPWKAFLDSNAKGSVAQSSVAASESKLESLEQRLQASIEKSVRVQFLELQQDADMAESQTEAASQQRILQMETDLTELRAQNQKFESWFKSAGDQVTALQQQVGSLNSQLQETSQATTSLAAVVGNLQGSWKTDLQTAMDAQFERIESALSKQRRTA